MNSTFAVRPLRRPVWSAAVFSLALLSAATVTAFGASTTGTVRGKVIAADSGEPIAYADVVLLPADTTMRPVGGLTNSDGTFLLVAPAGRYTLRVRALSYTVQRIDDVVVRAGELLPVSAVLSQQAIQQQQVEVEARARRNTESSMLSARRKAVALGDAVSAEQVRRSPDKDAAEVLRRVTGLSVSDGKYVFVRGLGERYSSTEVDGVRIASPEQNKRVVPLDLLPANLLENIVVQKTYTADRPGEFGGGDVQVHTKDFPGQRTWSFSLSQGHLEGTTLTERQTYSGGSGDLFGFGAHSRDVPVDVKGVPLPAWNSSSLAKLATMARSFNDVWSPHAASTAPNGSYSATYGDQLTLLGHPLGIIQSWSFSRSMDHQAESQRFFESNQDTLYDYGVDRWTASSQLGGVSALSYRLSPRHTLHVRGLYTNSADDEVRIYEGPDHNATEATTGTPLVHRNTRLLYVQRNVLSGAVEGQHEFAQLLGAKLDWKFSRSRARREQPDRREVTYDRRYYFEGDTAHWVLGSIGRREFGDLSDNGWGTTASATLPYRLGRLGSGKVQIGYDRQTKHRDSFYRRFNLYPNANVDREAPPGTVFDPSSFDSTADSGYLEDATLNSPEVGLDNYRANQRVSAGYVGLDVPFGRGARGNFGVRVEHGFQDVLSFALFRPDVVLAEGKLDDLDWLPSANVTWSVADAINLRLAASRTLSRPDLNELSPSPVLEYVGGLLVKGNTSLQRARIDNYDVRIEAFPALSEVLAAGFFYKRLQSPIESVIQGGTPHVLTPFNSDRGRNLGVELEARTSLGRLGRGLQALSINANASFISSDVQLRPQISKLGSDHHPLQGQARNLVNVALAWSSARGGTDMAILLSGTGRRLVALGIHPLPDVYQEPSTSLDWTLNVTPVRNARMKLAAKNLLDPRIEQLQGTGEVSGYRKGRSFSVAFSYGL